MTGSRLNVRRSKRFAEGMPLEHKGQRSSHADNRRVMCTFDPIAFACIQQLSQRYGLPFSAVVRFAVEMYLTGNQNNDIAMLSSRIKENRNAKCRAYPERNARGS
jgi:hypothetical protein